MSDAIIKSFAGMILALLSLVVLSGCASRQEVSEQAAPAGYSAQAVATLKAAHAARETQDDGQCRSYGAKPGTQSYVNCRLSLNQSRDQYDSRMRAEMHQRAEIEDARQRCRSRALMVAGATMMSSTSPYAGEGIAQGIQQGAGYAQASGC